MPNDQTNKLYKKLEIKLFLNKTTGKFWGEDIEGNEYALVCHHCDGELVNVDLLEGKTSKEKTEEIVKMLNAEN